MWVTYHEFRSASVTRGCVVIPPPPTPRSLSLLTCEVDTLVVPPLELLQGEASLSYLEPIQMRL